MSKHALPIPMISSASSALKGVVKIPGDKSISHRALILGALSVGETKITGLLEGEDVLNTAKAMESFGAEIIHHGEGVCSVHGVGVGGFCEPDHVIECGNSGTSVRLIMGAMATTPMTATFSGDASLNARPMARITDPLALFGATKVGRYKGRLPLTLIGAKAAIGVQYRLPVPSAQVKSAILLAGLNAIGQTVIFEPEPTRDHTERMLVSFGAELDIEHQEDGRVIRLSGHPELVAQKIIVPRDPSSAAFPAVAGLIVQASDILIPNIGLNPTRAGLYETLREMGADLHYENLREEGGEPVGDLRVKGSNLNGVDVPPERAASMIDEFPILAVAAAFARGKTVMRGIGELRVKESDRINAMVRGLRANGVVVEESKDMLSVHGMEADGVPGGGLVETFLDHRIAMAFLCLGLGAKKAVSIDDGAPISTSFPDFLPLMEGIGGKISCLS